jgi:hypothetical protein
LPRKFGIAPTRARSRSRSPAALRWTIHLLARLAITATWTSSAAAFDAEQAIAVAGRSPVQEVRATEAGQHHGLLHSQQLRRPLIASALNRGQRLNQE